LRDGSDAGVGRGLGNRETARSLIRVQDKSA
jgi:hypothetical protein